MLCKYALFEHKYKMMFFPIRSHNNLATVTAVLKLPSITPTPIKHNNSGNVNSSLLTRELRNYKPISFSCNMKMMST